MCHKISSQERDHVKRDLQRWLHKTKAPSDLNQYLGLQITWIDILKHFIKVRLSWKLAWLCIFCFKQKVDGASEHVNFHNLSSWIYHISWFSEAHVGFLRRCLELRRIAIRSEGSLGIEIPSQYFIGRTASGHDRLELEGVIVLHVKQGVIWEIFEVFSFFFRVLAVIWKKRSHGRHFGVFLLFPVAGRRLSSHPFYNLLMDVPGTSTYVSQAVGQSCNQKWNQSL